MQFFNVPSVGQLKKDTLFGEEDNHYGFIQSMVGEIYDRNKFKNSCVDYYMKKDNDRYWDQVITLLRFCGLRPLDANNRLKNIPFMDFVQKEYDKGNHIVADIWINYFLCKWQYPHPSLTRDRHLRELPIIKPYAIILAVLNNLFNKDPKSSFLSKEEFYWMGYSYINHEMNFEIDDIDRLTEEILSIRSQGKWDRMYEQGAYNTHLSYPQGILKNSEILTDNEKLFNVTDSQKVFIGLDSNFKNLSIIIDNLIHFCNNNKFTFDPAISSTDHQLEADFSKYIYNTDDVNSWLSLVNLFEFDSIIDTMELDPFDDSDYNNIKKMQIKKQLERLTVLDRESKKRKVVYRTEQKILRDYLFNGNEGNCAICGRIFPAEFCACAHIKKRADCSDEEKRDINVVMPACYFGCDSLYEKGFIYINKGKIKKNLTDRSVTDDLVEYVRMIEGRECSYYTSESKKYFTYHRNKALNG